MARWKIRENTAYLKSKRGHEFTHPFLDELAMMALFSWMAQKPPVPAYSYA